MFLFSSVLVYSIDWVRQRLDIFSYLAMSGLWIQPFELKICKNVQHNACILMTMNSAVLDSALNGGRAGR